MDQENRTVFKFKSPAPKFLEQRVQDKNGREKLIIFTKSRFLGKGGFANCYIYRDLVNQKDYAVKVIPKYSNSFEDLQNELEIHRSLCHRNIVRLEKVIQAPSYMCLFMELCNEKTLQEVLQRRKSLTEPEVRFYMLQIISALDYCHKNKVVHRDLKPANLFLKNTTVKLGDFGLAGTLLHESEQKKRFCGTPSFMAPEMLMERSYRFEVDIWALGVTFYTLLIGSCPFEDEDGGTYQRIKNGIYSIPETSNLSQEAKDLIKKILVTDPSKRPSLEEIRKHPFFDGKTPKDLPTEALYKQPTPQMLDEVCFQRSNTQQKVEPCVPSVPLEKKLRQMTSESKSTPTLQEQDPAQMAYHQMNNAFDSTHQNKKKRRGMLKRFFALFK